MKYWFRNLLISLGITILVVILSLVGILTFDISNLNVVFMNFLIWILLNQSEDMQKKS